jgi:hypothetical protein
MMSHWGTYEGICSDTRCVFNLGVVDIVVYDTNCCAFGKLLVATKGKFVKFILSKIEFHLYEKICNIEESIKPFVSVCVILDFSTFFPPFY